MSREIDIEIAGILGHKVCDKNTAIALSNATKPTEKDTYKLFTWTPFDDWYVGDYYLEDTSSPRYGLEDLPHYSTNIADASIVKDWLVKNGWLVWVGTHRGGTGVRLHPVEGELFPENTPDVEVFSSTEEMAICLAVKQLSRLLVIGNRHPINRVISGVTGQ